ncbi:MAG: DUF2249 domain-containing protein [Ginsengibacter sp.]
MIITANTKIAAILKENPAALESIISINPRFEKLRNPLLRKLMAGRTSIAMASKISGCNVNDFFQKLSVLGFVVDSKEPATVEQKPNLPSFFNLLKPDQIIELDVRATIDAGEDPLSIIIKSVKKLKQGQSLKIINTFEPTPLLSLLKKQGFESYVDHVNEDLVETYFYRSEYKEIDIEETANNAGDWDYFIQKYTDNIETINVQQLEMPGPMMAILGALETLPLNKALLVYHKRIPVFLLPELKEKDFDFRIKEIRDGEVQLLIFKN